MASTTPTRRMTSHPTPNWSQRLQQQTRDAIEELPVTADGRLHFKHASLGYAHAAYDDLCNDGLILHASSDGDVYHFAGVDDLLLSGWALD